MTGDTIQFISGLEHHETRILANAIFGAPLLQLFSDSALPAGEPARGEQPWFTEATYHAHQADVVFNLTPARQQWLLDLDQQPSSLRQFLANIKDQRLGALYERLWQFFLQQDTDVDLLASNLPVRSAENTLGEFDMIYHHRFHGIVHLEVACKFYLATSAQTGQWHHWLGPGKRDRLDIKLQRMMQQQINLSDNPLARSTLLDAISTGKPDATISSGQEPVKRHLHVAGRLFYPPGDDGQYQAPAGLNKQHYRASHMPVSGWTKKQIEWNSPCALLTKPLWLDLPGNTGKALVDDWSLAKNLLQEKLETYRQPQMIVQQMGEGYEYLFITPDDWPG